MPSSSTRITEGLSETFSTHSKKGVTFRTGLRTRFSGTTGWYVLRNLEPFPKASFGRTLRRISIPPRKIGKSRGGKSPLSDFFRTSAIGAAAFFALSIRPIFTPTGKARPNTLIPASITFKKTASGTCISRTKRYIPTTFSNSRGKSSNAKSTSRTVSGRVST